MQSTHELQVALRPLVGATLVEAILLVVPTDEDIADAPRDLLLRVSGDGEYECVLSIWGNGQSPRVDSAEWVAEQRDQLRDWRELPARVEAWGQPEFWASRSGGGFVYELFNILDHEDWPLSQGEKIEQVNLAVFSTDRTPTGIEFVFARGRVSVVPGVYGGIVLPRPILQSLREPVPCELLPVV